MALNDEINNNIVIPVHFDWIFNSLLNGLTPYYKFYCPTQLAMNIAMNKINI